MKNYIIVWHENQIKRYTVKAPKSTGNEQLDWAYSLGDTWKIVPRDAEMVAKIGCGTKCGVWFKHALIDVYKGESYDETWQAKQDEFKEHYQQYLTETERVLLND